MRFLRETGDVNAFLKEVNFNLEVHNSSSTEKDFPIYALLIAHSLLITLERQELDQQPWLSDNRFYP